MTDEIANQHEVERQLKALAREAEMILNSNCWDVAMKSLESQFQRAFWDSAPGYVGQGERDVAHVMALAVRTLNANIQQFLQTGGDVDLMAKMKETLGHEEVGADDVLQ